MSIAETNAERFDLPPGQRALEEFPQFGVIAFARRRLEPAELRLEIRGLSLESIALTRGDLESLPRRTMTTDFHCAAGWSHRAITWSGFSFADVWSRFVAPHLQAPIGNVYAVLRCQDGYRTSLPVADLLNTDVLLADRIDGAQLSMAHGFPLRLVAPSHYGYKSAKHLIAVELRSSDQPYRPLLPRFMEHPRARVALEERGQILPGWLLRYLFRPMIQPIIRKIKALGTHRH